MADRSGEELRRLAGEPAPRSREELLRLAEDPRRPPGRAPADPAKALDAVEQARQELERRLIEEGADPEAAAETSRRQAARLLVVPATAAGTGVEAAIAAGEDPSLSASLTRAFGRRVRNVETGEPPSQEDRDEHYRRVVGQMDASLGNLKTAADAFHLAWDPHPEGTPAEASPAQDRSRAWMDKAWDYAKTSATYAALPSWRNAYTLATDGLDLAESYGSDPTVQKVTSPSGLADIGQRAAAKMPGTAELLAVAETMAEDGYVSRNALRGVRQKVMDMRPDEDFDAVAPHLQRAAATRDPETWIQAQEAILGLSPATIPDADQVNQPEVARFRRAYAANPDAFAAPTWDAFRRRMEQQADDGEVATALRHVPFVDLARFQPDIPPTLDVLARLAERREKARNDTGGLTTDALMQLVAAAVTEPTVVDGKPVLVESRAGRFMRLAGVAFEMLAEADVPVGEIVPPYRIAAAGLDKAGATDLANAIRATRLPTKRGLDLMLASGAYDGALRRMGLGPYRPLLGDDDSTWAARVLANLSEPEYLGTGLPRALMRAGASPTSTMTTAADVIDLGAMFLIPAESIVGGAVAAPVKGAARAMVGARAMAPGYKAMGALAKAAPGLYSIVHDVPLRDLDGDTALQAALVASTLDMVRNGKDPSKVLPPRVMDNVKDALRSVGVDPDGALAGLTRHAEYRRTRIMGKMDDLLSGEATPEQAALRATPAYQRRAAEYDALVRNRTLSHEHARLGLLMDEVRAFNAADDGIYATPEEYFGRLKREVAPPGARPNPGAFLQGDAPAPTFYSGLRRAVENVKQEKLTADQLRATLRNTPGVKADEIEWTGLETFLAEHPKPTKTEVLGWLDEHAVTVEERRLGGQQAPSAEEQARYDHLRGAWEEGTLEPDEAAELGRMSRQAAARAAVPPTYYSRYQLPGGTAYREMLFKLPEGGYDSPHFGAEGRGLLAHARVSDRVGPNGEKLLHVEEVQSDWHQAGREKGYKVSPDEQARLDAAQEAADKAWQEASKRAGVAIGSDESMALPEYAAYRPLREKADTARYGVGAAPFAKTWHELVLKRVLREAAEGGYDGVTWTTGVTQVKRYEDATRAVVDEVRWERPKQAGVAAEKRLQDAVDAHQAADDEVGRLLSEGADERKVDAAIDVRDAAESTVEAARSDVHAAEVVARTYRGGETDVEIVGIKNGREVYRDTMPPEKVADVLGKGMAARIAESTEASGSLTGADLTVGGEGMKGFYDGIIPAFLQKYTKKWGGRVGETKIRVGRDEHAFDFPADPSGDVPTSALPHAEPVHYLPLTPQLRDAVLHEGQSLFQTRGGAVRGSIEPVMPNGRVIGYLQRFFRDADFDTLLHEDGHLLRFLFGDRWTGELIRHFDHAVDPQGFTTLTRKGEEQAAEAIRWWMRTRVQPNGRLRGMLDELTAGLSNLWLGVRREPQLVPAEVAALLDATLRPDDAVRPRAVQLVDEELSRVRRQVGVPERTPEGDIEAAATGPVGARGRAVEASRVPTDPQAVRRALNLNADDFGRDMPVDELVANLVAMVGVEHARQRWTGETLKVISPDSVVPASRVARVRRDVAADLRSVLGENIAGIVQDGVVRLDDGQAAGVYGLISRLAAEPAGVRLSRAVLDFDPARGDRVLTVDAWNGLQEVLTDSHAGVGSSRNALAEAAQGTVLVAFARALRSSLIGLDPESRGTIREAIAGLERRFVMAADGAQYGSPQLRAARDRMLRRFGEVPNDVRALMRAVRAESPGDATLADLLRQALPHVGADVPPGAAADLLEMHRTLQGEAAALDVDTFTAPARLNNVEALLSGSFRGATADERMAMDALRRFGGQLRAAPDEAARQALIAANAPVISDAVSIVQTGIARRWGSVEKIATDIWWCLAGDDDRAVTKALGKDANLREPTENAYVLAYQLFHGGDFEGLFRLADERAGLRTSGPQYKQGNAVLAMFSRLRAQEIASDFAREVTELGMGADDAAIRGTTLDARNPAAYALGSRSGGRDAFAQRVQDQINAIISWKESELKVPGRGLEPAEGASGPVGLEDLEAFTTAYRVLNEMGWKVGKGAFNDTPVLFADGSMVFLPQMIAEEISTTIERTAKVGVAFADTAKGGETARMLGLAREADAGHIAALTDKEIAELSRVRKAKLAGAAVGGSAGAVLSGPIGAGVGALVGSKLAPEVMLRAGEGATEGARMARDLTGGMAPVGAALGGAVGAGAGLLTATFRTALDTLLSAVSTTTTLARVGMTTGLGLPNISSFVGNLWGAFFQAGQVVDGGYRGALRAWFGEPRFIGDVVGRLWGDGPGRYRPGSRPIVTADGRILAAEAVARDFNTLGLDSSYVKSESSEALAKDVLRDVGTWMQRFGRDPKDATLEVLHNWQEFLTEAWTSIDNMNRVAVYVDAVKGGASRETAAEAARLAAFDYGHLAEFERGTMRSTIIFYGFLRQNIRLFWWTMLNHPDRVLGQLRLAGGLQRMWLEEPDLTAPDYLDGRLMIWFRKASEDAYARQGVAMLAPPIPAADVMILLSDLLGMKSLERETWEHGVNRLVPPLQVPIALGFDIDPRSGRELIDQAGVPPWLVESDRLMTGGQLVDAVLRVERLQNADPSRDTYEDSGYYRARNAPAWLIFRTLVQFPPFGRSADTLERMDRAFGRGPISSAVAALRTYRAAGGNPELDAFADTVLPKVLWPLAATSSEVPNPELPFRGPADVVLPRSGITPAEEVAGVFGFVPTPIETPGARAARVYAEIVRAAEEYQASVAKGAEHRIR